MIKDPQITMFDLVVCLSDAMDLVSPALVNHHKKVAYIASSLGKELGLSEDVEKDLFLAGALHDIGALSLMERIETLEFETQNSLQHSLRGSNLLLAFQPLAYLNQIIRFHHVYWDNGKGREYKGEEVPFESHIIHLADRIAVSIDKNREVLEQVQDICKIIKRNSGKMFSPEIVEAFLELAQKEYFWFDATSPTIYRTLRQNQRLKTVALNLSQLNDLAFFFSRIIDFRSHFTSTHSSGVAASAETLASLVGFSKRECQYMRIAGYLHDFGKLAVPKEILEKQGKLTREEFNIIRRHSFYTYRILDTLADFDTINTWGAFHHERLDGNGYPFHHKKDDLSLGSRIMCIADVFTAITEERPYRKGLHTEEVISILKKMGDDGGLDSKIISILEENIDIVNNNRQLSQASSREYYQKLFS